jgi:anti-anti-sigma regulatory factor
MIGEFDLANVQPLKDCLAAWVILGNREAIIDMAGAEFIDSTVIGVLVTAQVAGMMLTVRGATGAVRHALDVARVDGVVTIERESDGNGQSVSGLLHLQDDLRELLGIPAVGPRIDAPPDHTFDARSRRSGCGSTPVSTAAKGGPMTRVSPRPLD